MPQVIRAPLVVNKIEELRWLVPVRNESAVLHSIFRRLCWLPGTCTLARASRHTLEPRGPHIGFRCVIGLSA